VAAGRGGRPRGLAVDVTVYHEPGGTAGLGGAEVATAVLAHALRDRHAVEVVCHIPDLTAARLGEFARVDLGGVAVRTVPHPPHRGWVPPGAGVWNLGRALRGWKADLSRGCDLFVTGEMKHHEVLGALNAGMSVLLGNHTSTERGYLPRLAARLRELAPEVPVLVSQVDQDPLVTV